jgi:hypothetical protein
MSLRLHTLFVMFLFSDHSAKSHMGMMVKDLFTTRGKCRSRSEAMTSARRNKWIAIPSSLTCTATATLHEPL